MQNKAFILYPIFNAKTLSNFVFFCGFEIVRIKYSSDYRKYSSNSSSIVILINLCSLDYHDLILFLEDGAAIREGNLISEKYGTY